MLTRRSLLASLALALGGWTVVTDEPKEAFDPNAPKSAGVHFTRPDGTPIYVNPHAVAFVRAPLPGESGNATIVFSNGAKQSVSETVEQVIRGVTMEKEVGR